MLLRIPERIEPHALKSEFVDRWAPDINCSRGLVIVGSVEVS